ncbi:MAG: shikimate kinase [Aliihoeflea sp.]|uniref:shikimate kinase n=1 Tax=Aliihoeflea sp. 40Bstr573 TaxID=2696467 RepID=UPI00209509A2|nr:shikimate kinase [Aliihoeflea sp. 40Bstr573]MCO6386303.1 shikimate kinase [Aliihoeflea sp. 40Bstr573]
MGATAMTELIEHVRARIGTRTLVLVGLMGAGKTSVGRKVAQALQLPFADSDHEIESVSRMTVPELFEAYGEVEFRALEQRVVTRLIADGPAVIATGGGAFMNADTRAAIRAHAISIWLKADLDTLMERVARRQNRPLLKTPDPRAMMRKLMEDRYPVYAEADLTVTSRDARHTVIAGEIIEAVNAKLNQSMTKVD